MARPSAAQAALEKLLVEQWLPLRNPDTFPQTPQFIEESYVVLSKRRPVVKYIEEAHRHFSKINNSRSKVKPMVRWRRSRPTVDVGCVSYAPADAREKQPEIQRVPLLPFEQPAKSSADVLTGQLRVGSSSSRHVIQQNLPYSSEPTPARVSSNSVGPVPSNLLMVVNTEQGKVLVTLPNQTMPTASTPLRTELSSRAPSKAVPSSGPTLTNHPRSVQAVSSPGPPCNAEGLNQKFRSPYSVPPASRNCQQPSSHRSIAAPSSMKTGNTHSGGTPFRQTHTNTGQPGPASSKPARTQDVRTAESAVTLPPGPKTPGVVIAEVDLTDDSSCRAAPSSQNLSPKPFPVSVIQNRMAVHSKERSRPTQKHPKSWTYQSARRTTGPPQVRLTVQQMKTIYCPLDCSVKLKRLGRAKIRRMCKRKSRHANGEMAKTDRKPNRQKSSTSRSRKLSSKPLSCPGETKIVPKLKLSLKHLYSIEEQPPVEKDSKNLVDSSSEKENFPTGNEGSKTEICSPIKRGTSPAQDTPPKKKIDLSLVKCLDLKTAEPIEKNEPCVFIKPEEPPTDPALPGSFFNMAATDVNLNYKVPTNVVARGALDLKSLKFDLDARSARFKAVVRIVDTWRDLCCTNCSNVFPSVEKWSSHHRVRCVPRAEIRPTVR